jgi:hypothetical protein
MQDLGYGILVHRTAVSCHFHQSILMPLCKFHISAQTSKLRLKKGDHEMRRRSRYSISLCPGNVILYVFAPSPCLSIGGHQMHNFRRKPVVNLVHRMGGVGWSIHWLAANDSKGVLCLRCVHAQHSMQSLAELGASEVHLHRCWRCWLPRCWTRLQLLADRCASEVKWAVWSNTASELFRIGACITTRCFKLLQAFLASGLLRVTIEMGSLRDT